MVHEASPSVRRMLPTGLKGLKLKELIEVERPESVVHGSVAEREGKSEFLFRFMTQKIS